MLARVAKEHADTAGPMLIPGAHARYALGHAPVTRRPQPSGDLHKLQRERMTTRNRDAPSLQFASRSTPSYQSRARKAAITTCTAVAP